MTKETLPYDAAFEAAAYWFERASEALALNPNDCLRLYTRDPLTSGICWEDARRLYLCPKDPQASLLKLEINDLVLRALENCLTAAIRDTSGVERFAYFLIDKVELALHTAIILANTEGPPSSIASPLAAIRAKIVLNRLLERLGGSLSGVYRNSAMFC